MKGPLLKPTEIQFATKSMLGTTTNGEHRKLIGVKIRLLLGYGILLLLFKVLQVFQNRNYELQRRLSGVPPNQQSRQKYVCRCTCVACGNLSVFHYIIMWLSSCRYGEALWRGFLYMTKLEYSIFTTALCGCRASVMERRCGEAFYTRLA